MTNVILSIDFSRIIRKEVKQWWLKWLKLESGMVWIIAAAAVVFTCGP